MNLAVGEGETALGAFLKIGTDNRITVAVPQAEMGQGVWTVLPQILADALGANWSMVGVEPAPIGPAYANELLLRRLEEMALPGWRSEEHTSELQSLMRISYAVFCLKKKTTSTCIQPTHISSTPTH